MHKIIEKYLDLALIDANGVEIIDSKAHDYITQNYRYLLNSTAINKVLNKVLYPKENGISKEFIIAKLLQNYVYYNYDPTYSFIRFLTDNDMSKILFEVENNERLLRDLIVSYYASFKMTPPNLGPETFDLINKLKCEHKVIFLSDIIRENFELLYNSLLYSAKDSVNAAIIMDKAIFGKAIIAGDEKVESAATFLKAYKGYLARLIISDIYEDLAAQKVEYDLTKPAVRIIAQRIVNNNYDLPTDLEERRLLLNYFAYLCTCEEQRSKNKSMLGKDKEVVLKRINPLWKLDESVIINKR